jgi:hypothetical protein
MFAPTGRAARLPVTGRLSNMRFHVVALLSALILPAYGAVTSVQMGDPGRQQGIVSFRVANPGRCTLTVYTDYALSSKVDDTNETVFPGSASCDRAYNLVDGTRVTAVIGRRTSELAADGKMHSRSLEVAHTYYVVITDLTDSTTASASFTTSNIPWGDTHVEEVPYSPSGYNHWAYPDLDWTDAGQNTSYVDPVSGVSFKRGPRPLFGQAGIDGKQVNYEFQFPVAFDVSSAWTNAQNAKSTSTAGPFATYAGTAQASLYLPFWADPSDGSTLFSPYMESGPSADDIRVNLYGYAADTGNVEDRKVLICLATQYNPSTNTCNTAEREMTLPASAGSVQFPTSYPSFPFAGWGFTKALTQNEITIPNAMYWGNISVTNSVATLNTQYLPPYVAPGMKINIDGSWYTIGSIQDAAHFTVAERGVTVANKKWYLGALGIRIRKKTATGNQINVALTYSVAWSTGIKMPYNGNPDFCSQLTFPITYAADGTTPLNQAKKGRLCWNGGEGNGFLFLMADDGETRYLSPLSHPDASGTGVPAKIPWGAFSATDPYTLIGFHTDDGGNTTNRALYEIKYNPSTCHFKTWAGNGYDIHSYPSDCVTWTNMTPYSQHKTVTEQLTAALASNPVWDPSFNVNNMWGLLGISGRWASFSAFVAGQESVCLNAVFDLSTYTLVKVFDSISGSLPNVRWGGCHNAGLSIPPGANYGISGMKNLYGIGNYLSGPYITKSVIAKSLDGGATWNTNTSLAPGALVNAPDNRCGTSPWTVGSKCVDLTNAATTCSPNPYGVTGPQCVKFKISHDVPCNANTTAGGLDLGKWPCPWHSGWAAGPSQMTVQPGDYITNISDPNNISNMSFNGKNEKMRVLSKASDGNGNWILELQRWAACDNPTSDFNNPTQPATLYWDHLFTDSGGATYPNGWNAGLAATGACSGTAMWVNVNKPLAQTDSVPDNNQITVGHFTVGIAPDNTSIMQVGYGASRSGTLPGMAGTAPNFNWSNSSSSFNGIVRGSSSNEVESYPSLSNWTSPTTQKRSLAWDFRHLNPDSGTNPEDLETLYSHTYTLVSGQSFTYKVSIYGDTHDFKSRPVNVFSTLTAFKNISSPATGNVIDDSKPNTWCQAYKANECRTGSAAGDVYVVAKNALVGSNACITDTYKTYTPCVTPLWSYGGWMTEVDTQKDDPLGYRFRRITMGLVAPSAQYQYTSPHMTPDGQYAFVRAGYVNGVRSDPVMIKVPPPAPFDSIDRSSFVMLPMSFPAGSGQVRVRFGYAENGTVSQFYCTTRQEACLTDSKGAPFAFEQSDALKATDCSAGCTIKVPALSGRVIYYRVEKSVDGSTGWIAGPTQVRTVQ